MSLPARQQRVLERMERSLHACDPRLRSMFAIFTKLTRDEEMPRQEELERRSLPPFGWLTRLRRPGQAGRTAIRARAIGAPGTLLGVAVIVPIALLLLTPAVFFGQGVRSVRPTGFSVRLENTAQHRSGPLPAGGFRQGNGFRQRDVDLGKPVEPPPDPHSRTLQYGHQYPR
jgi:hypothetical protein